MLDVTVVVTARPGQRAYPGLTAPGLRELRDRAEIVVVGEPDLADLTGRAGLPFVPQSRPGRATARNIGLAVATTSLVAFVDAHCLPRRGWLDGLTDGIEGHAAAIGRTEPEVAGGCAAPATAVCAGGADRAQLAPQPERVPAGYQCPLVSPAGGSAIFDRRLLREVGAFDPRVRYWDDLYITARLLGYGQTVGQADRSVVAAPRTAGQRQRLAERSRYAYWLADLRHSGELGGAGVRTGDRASVATVLGSAARVLRPPQRPRLDHWLPVLTRSRLADPRVVHLTIDDGPGQGTAALLRVLRGHDARADFFLIGDQVRGHRTLPAEIRAQGHAVHNHSLTHRQFDMLGADEIVAELDRTHRLIGSAAGPGPPLVRLPFGAGTHDRYVHNAIRRWQPSCELVGWSVDSFDYKAWPQCGAAADVEREARACADRVLRSPDLAGSIILMHDGGYGAHLPLAERFSEVFLDLLLGGLARHDLSTAPLGSPRTATSGPMKG